VETYLEVTLNYAEE